MAVEEILRPEAEIVRRLKRAVGDIPVMVTLDLHANEDEELVDAADGVFIIKTYPHLDSEEIGYKAAHCLFETIRGRFRPVMALRKPGVITPSVFQGTDYHPAKEIMDRARWWEESEERIYCVSVAFGFAYADVPDAGATVVAVADGDEELAEKAAQDVSRYIWRLRRDFFKELPGPREGVARAIRAAKRGETPVIIADHSDRTGDGTHILRELMEQGAESFCVATIADEEAIREIEEEAGVGKTITLEIGGYATELSGRPVRLRGVVEYLDDCEYTLRGPMGRGRRIRLGRVAVLGFGRGNHVIITPTLHQVIDDAIFPAVGIDFGEIEIIIIKSRVHFRAFYEEVAGTIIVVDAPGLGPADLTKLHYRNVPRDLYPLCERSG